MSVATPNKFALLQEDDPRPSTPPPPPPAPTSPQQPAPAKRSRGGPAARGGRYYQRGGARQNTDRDPPSSEDPPPASDNKQKRSDGERRERGRGRGAYRGRGRTFDKHSATGKVDTDKKIHNGWGGDDANAELKAEEAATIDAAAESGGLNDWAAPAESSANDWAAPADTSANDWAAPADTSANGWDAPSQEPAPEQSPEAAKPDGTRRRDRDPEEEDNTLTLDQYFAQQKDKEHATLPKLETRRANEGANDAIWDGATRLEKGQEVSYFSGKTRSVPKARTEKKEKVFLDIDVHFDRPSRGGRGRGGDRGEGRGRGGRGRGGRGRGAANGTAGSTVNVDDEAAFPSLA